MCLQGLLRHHLPILDFFIALLSSKQNQGPFKFLSEVHKVYSTVLCYKLKYTESYNTAFKKKKKINKLRTQEHFLKTLAFKKCNIFFSDQNLNSFFRTAVTIPSGLKFSTIR